jgi:hypothetical protein
VVALVAVMGLCVPKRLFERRWLAAVSAVMVLAGVGVGLAQGDAQQGLAAYLGLASLIQAAVVVLTLAGAPTLRLLHEGRVAKTAPGCCTWACSSSGSSCWPCAGRRGYAGLRRRHALHRGRLRAGVLAAPARLQPA